MRHKAGGRKAGERRPVLSSAGIRAGANTVVQESPTLTAVGVGGHPLGSRPTEESESYYNNPNVQTLISTNYQFSPGSLNTFLNYQFQGSACH